MFLHILYNPVLDGFALRGKAGADFHYFLVGCGILEGVVTGVNLIEGILGGSVDYQFDDIDGVRHVDHHADVSSGTFLLQILVSFAKLKRKWEKRK